MFTPTRNSRLSRVLSASAAAGFVALMAVGLSGCSKPAVEETRDSKGNLQFPDTGRPPTAEELKKIGTPQQPPAPPANP
jgi:hypothetical protein